MIGYIAHGAAIKSQDAFGPYVRAQIPLRKYDEWDIWLGNVDKVCAPP